VRTTPAPSVANGASREGEAVHVSRADPVLLAMQPVGTLKLSTGLPVQAVPANRLTMTCPTSVSHLRISMLLPTRWQTFSVVPITTGEVSSPVQSLEGKRRIST